IMIEIIYKKEKQKPVGNEGYFRIPNNIRQIGEINEAQKIYIEDYAYTYLSRLSNDKSDKGQAAVLLGQTNWLDGVSYLFVKSAIALPDMEISEDYLVFTDDVWNQVYEKNKEYFGEQEIVGWFLSIPGCSMELHEVICRTHLDHFGGSDKVLFVMEPTEKEEAFYRYENSKLTRQLGFYIYYEKNEPMQNYLISQNENMPRDEAKVEDKAVKNFRKKVEAKAEAKPQKRAGSLVYAASACVLIGVLAVGTGLFNNYNKLRDAKDVVASAADTHSQKDTDKEPVVQKTPVNGLASESQGKEPQDEPKDKTQGGSKEDEDSAKKEAESIEHQVPEDTKKPFDNADAAQPSNGQSAAQYYTIKRGDTLTSISNKYYGNSAKIAEICSANGMSEDETIYPGQIILLP
ncbi:LysM peptidoglycan-binding domain-containing protein, partial [Lactonifactor longoviformis]|uniref:LysM peptidoglycan-binding domain-containing protein n=1 Tax=Lactonifactor longoviformis TaxID=341220 RepID=UPI001FA8FC95